MHAGIFFLANKKDGLRFDMAQSKSAVSGGSVERTSDEVMPTVGVASGVVDKSDPVYL